MTWPEVVDGAVLGVVILGLAFFVAVVRRGWPTRKRKDE